MATNPCAGEQEGNNLLRALRPNDLALLTPYLEIWSGARGQVIYNPGDDVTHVYFPCGASVACFLTPLPEGELIEAALVGREGAIGGVVSEGNLPAFARAEVQSAGQFLRMPIKRLDAAKRSSPAIRTLFARYADCLLAQVFQSVACNAAHTIEQRTAKWLLAAMDRTGQEKLALTQDQLAGMLGIGRSYLTRVVKPLRERGLIDTGRGMIRVLNRSALETVSCGCDEAWRRHFGVALRGVYPGPRD
ncbi:Crp/Fnr family transcriptional regulator [Methylocystis echinoides]|jgi:CRP-like cAMP-binding protein|uniref:Crp/Fnr family transcriptional regulator n=1 Tax=Methylocystis echinoides TaxID=29468 RepID=UPI00341D2DC7